MPIGEDDVRRALHQGSGTVAQKSALGTDITSNDNAIFGAGIVISRDRWMVRYLFSNIITFSAIRVVVFASIKFTQNWVVWFFHTLRNGQLELRMLKVMPFAFFFFTFGLICHPDK